MLLEKSIKELASGLKEKKFSSEDLVRECYENIEKLNPVLNVFVTLRDKDEVIKEAREKDKKTPVNSLLYGLPFVIKDSYNTKGIRTTASSKVLETYIPPYNATVYQKLLDAGAILIGKTNMDAWGHGASSENTDFGPVRNPWDNSRVAGGSSGGNAAAIAARMAVFGIGEDTGGSIRNPSGWCNITGLKVTYGRVSRYGCIAYVSSFDTVGPMARTAEDCAIILQVTAGKDPLDATSSPEEVPDYGSRLNGDIKGMTIGMPKECYGEGVDNEIKSLIYKAAEQYAKLGVEIKEISMPMLEYGVPVYYLIGTSETSSNLARYDGIRYGNGRNKFTSETMRRIMLGTYALSAGYYDAYYKKAQQGRTLFIKEYAKAFTQCDAILMPIEPMPATKLGELIGDPVKNMLADIFTCQTPVGIPSLAVPVGFTKSNLPVGMQLLGNMFSEPLLLKLGYFYQKVTDWHKKSNL
ncbi:aspartyl/glutamyl-tRNA amidotransferase subunit A [Patescibacteria group bacterium]|nr:aspartyl/glutamyl-tRNA amidotransferase subunit A [Patescibacteria group bacterium]MCL5798263.1 aspartyl/glutamyl-tRNA amidotransferase subunit A [Patescibacteria group bacterium]